MPLCYECMEEYEKAVNLIFCSKKCSDEFDKRTAPLRRMLEKGFPKNMPLSSVLKDGND